MIAVLINCLAIIAGSILGLTFSKKLPEHFSDVVSIGAGVVSLVIGVQIALQLNSVVGITLAVIIGGLIGTAFDIDGKILLFGAWLETKLQLIGKRKSRAFRVTMYSNIITRKHFSYTKQVANENNFAHAFLNATVLYCAGALSILSSFAASLEHDFSLMFTKAVLDGFMSIVFAATMGLGVLFSFVSVLVYQGLLVAFARVLRPLLSVAMMSDLSGAGGVLILMISINLLDLKKIKTANYLPALVFAPLFSWLGSFVKL